MKLKNLVLAASTIATLLVSFKAYAAPSTGMCNYNNQTAMRCTLDGDAETLTIIWQDGVTDTYQKVGSNADRVNLIDTRGGEWHYFDHRNCRDFEIINVDNGNRIVFTGDGRAC